MSVKNIKLSAWIMSMFTFLTLLSTSAFAAPRIFSNFNLGRTLTSMFEAEFRIPHIGDYQTERVRILTFLAVWAVLSIVTYLITQEGPLKYFHHKTKPAIWFSICLSLVAIYSAPIVEWIQELIIGIATVGYIIVIALTFLVIFWVYHFIFTKIREKIPKEKTADQIEKALKRKEEIKKHKKTHNRAIKYSNIDHPNPKETIETSKNEMESANVDMSSLENKDMIVFIDHIDKMVQNFPLFKKDKDIGFIYGTPDGQALINATYTFIQKLSLLAKKMNGNSKEFKELNEKITYYNNLIKEFEASKKIPVGCNQGDFEKAIDELENHSRYYGNLYKSVENDFDQINQLLMALRTRPDSHNLTRFRETLDNEVRDITNKELAFSKYEIKFAKKHDHLVFKEL